MIGVQLKIEWIEEENLEDFQLADTLRQEELEKILKILKENSENN
jgi:hypothetical protein